MVLRGNQGQPLGDEEEGPDLIPPEEGFKLYRHKDPEKMRTKS